MKNAYSSRKIFIPAFAVIIVVAIIMSSYFFNTLQKTFRLRRDIESFHHLEEISVNISESLRLKFQKNWYTVESLSIFLESTNEDNFQNVQRFFQDKKYKWNVNDLAFYTESGKIYNEKGHQIEKNQVSNYLKIIDDINQVYFLEGKILNYLYYTKSNLKINNEKIIAVSTSVDLTTLFKDCLSNNFAKNAFACLLDNYGNVIVGSTEGEKSLGNNLFSFLKNCEVETMGESFSIDETLINGKSFTGKILNNNSNNKFYMVSYPLEAREKYEPVKCHLLFIVPEETINDNHYDFSGYVTRVSAILIIIICILMLIVFLLAYKSKSKLIQTSMKEHEVSQNEKLKLALAMAEQSNNAKTSFLSNMSHDIRTPLNAIISMTDFALQEKNISPKINNYLEIIKKSSNHLMQLINNVLDITRIESGKLIIKQEPFDLSSLIDDVTNIVRSDCKKKKLTLYTESSALEHNMLVGDKLNLQRVLINLLSNAVKFTPELGSIWFTIEEQKSLRAGTSSLKFSVEDTGFGIKKENLDTIFRPFIRENTEKTTNIEGTGLGLAITKNLIESMGGCIHVQSEENKGTKFVVELFFPISSEKVVNEKKAKDEKRAGYDFGGIKALVVEDNSINRQIIGVLLQHININFDFAENGRIALEKFNAAPEKTYDLVYMDIQMPELNGYETTEALRNGEKLEGHTIPIIAMTANVFDEDVEKCRKVGMNAHIGKPIDPSQLAYVTNQVLSRQDVENFSDVVEK